MAQSKRGTLEARGKAALANSGSAAAAQAERIYDVVRAIPRAKVATYGQLALLAGIPAGHRVAARAMQQCPPGLAWYRVLAKKDARRAKIAVAEPEHAQVQRQRLAREGVRFDDNGFVSLRDHGWLPVEALASGSARNSQASVQKRSKRVGGASEKRKSR